MRVPLSGVGAFARASAVLLILLGGAERAAAQFPILYTWPGPSPCSGTLQACVDAATADDTVEIATNGPIDEEIVSSGSLDLQAAFGFTPRFAPGRSIRASSSGAADQAIRIQGLTLDGGSIDVNHLLNGGALSVQILDNVVEDGPANDRAIDVYTNGSGPLVFRIDRNEIDYAMNVAGGIRVTALNAFASGDIEQNEVLTRFSEGTAIELLAEEGALLADVVRNTISGDGHLWGVRVRGLDGAVIDLRIVGNAIETVNVVDGAAIAFLDPRATDGITDAEIVNNTIRYSSGGINVDGGDVRVANNLLATLYRVGLSVNGGGISNRNNLFFDVNPAVEGTTAGSGSVFADPGLVEGDFRIASSSPAAEAGDTASLPPDFTTDLYGAARVQGASVDIGAVEAPEPGGALASLTGIAVCAALYARARRPAIRARSARLRQTSSRPAARSAPS